jgi:hypothetical protein
MTPNAACVIVFGTYTKQRPLIPSLQSGEAVQLLVSAFGSEIEIPNKEVYICIY